MIQIVYGDISKSTGFSQRIRRQKKYVFDEIGLEYITINIPNKMNSESLKEYKAEIDKQYQNVIVFSNINEGKFKKAFKIFKLISKIRRERLTNILYCESFMASFLGSLYKLINPKVKLIIDIHGVAPEERFYYSKMSSVSFKFLKFIEFAYIKLAYHVICVSPKLKAHYESNYFKDSSRISVVPNCIFGNEKDVKPEMSTQEELTLNRKAKSWSEEDIVITYAGGIGVYHCLNEIVEFYINARKNNNNLKLQLLIPQNYDLQDVISFSDREKHSIKVLQVPHNKVSEYLKISDYLIILRENLLLNIVADPTKVPEYLSVGVPLIYTSSVSTVAENKFNISFNFDDRELVSKQQRFERVSYQNRTNLFKHNNDYLVKNYSWSNYIETYKEVFNES